MPIQKTITLILSIISFVLPAMSQVFNTVKAKPEAELKSDSVGYRRINTDTIAEKKKTNNNPKKIKGTSGIKNMALPLRNLKVTSNFGYRVHPIEGKVKFHSGIDLAAHQAYVYSILPGIVTETGYNSRLGKYVKVSHGDLTSIYGHLSRLLVKKGEPVMPGKQIAITGSSGKVTGEHLHFTLKFRDQYIDPVPWLIALCYRQLAVKKP